VNDSRNLAILGGALVTSSVIAFAFAGYFSTWSVPDAIESVTVSGVLLAWGTGILLYMSVGVVWSRIRIKHQSGLARASRILTWRSVGVIAVLSLVLLSAFFVLLYQETHLVGCFGCGPNAAVYINGASCYAASRSCQIVLINIGSSDRQLVGCFWTDPNTGRTLSNGTLLVNDTAHPLNPSAANPYTVPARGTVTAYCLGYVGTPTVGAWVVPGVKEAGGYLTSYWGSSTGNPVWK
jgi:hypothetical protein